MSYRYRRWLQQRKEGDAMNGPTRITHDEMHCGLCDHYRSKMIRSGRPALWEHTCHNPDALSDYEKRAGRGRVIGNEDYTPRWCPYLQDNAPMLGNKGE